jgi:hypothetical protein
MARIQLRDTTIYLQDGLSGTALSNESVVALLAGTPVDETTPGVDSSTDEVQTIAIFATPVTGSFTLTLNLEGEDAFTTAAIAYNANAAAIETAIDVAATAAGVTGWTNGDISVSGGPLTTTPVVLTFDGTSVEQSVQGLTVVNPAGLIATAGAGATNLDIDTVSLNTSVTTKVPVGARFTIADELNSPVHTVTGRTGGDTTTNIVFTPAMTGGGANNAVITFLPQRLEIKIGEGDLSWTESRELIYDRDRDQLDTVRLGQEQPVSVDLAFTFEYVTTQSGQAITPVDAIKRIGEATEWVSSSADLCEPYAVDIYVVHDVPCGTDQNQDFLFPDFRYESLDYSMQDATIAVTGQCNATDVVTTRFA